MVQRMRKLTEERDFRQRESTLYFDRNDEFLPQESLPKYFRHLATELDSDDEAEAAKLLADKFHSVTVKFGD
jgi:hypothetical protein